jgi:hypothetical protein
MMMTAYASSSSMSASISPPVSPVWPPGPVDQAKQGFATPKPSAMRSGTRPASTAHAPSHEKPKVWRTPSLLPDDLEGEHSELIYKLSQGLSVGIPLSSFLPELIRHYSQKPPTPTTYSARVHGINPKAVPKQALRSKGSGWIEVLSAYSSDFSKMVQNFWRLTTVLPGDIMRWGFRGFSQIYIQPLLEVVRAGSRNLIAPAIQQTLLPTLNGKPFEASGALYPHLQPDAFHRLAEEVKDVKLSQLGGLFNVLTDKSATASYEHLPTAMQSLKVHRQNSQGHWEAKSFARAYPALAHHLNWMARGDDIMADNATLAKFNLADMGGLDVLRLHTPDSSAGYAALKPDAKVNLQNMIYNGTVGAFRHLKSVKLDEFLSPFASHLELAANGHFTDVRKPNGSFHARTAKASLEQAASLKENRSRIAIDGFVDYFMQFIHINEQDAKLKHLKWMPFYPTILEQGRLNFKHHLELQKKANVPFAQDPGQLEHFFRVLYGGTLMLGDRVDKEISFQFDPEDVLGVKHEGVQPATFAAKMAPLLDRLIAIEEQSRSAMNQPGQAGEHYQKEHQRLLKDFEHTRMAMGTQLGVTGENRTALKRVLSYNRHHQNGSSHDAMGLATQGATHTDRLSDLSRLSHHYTLTNWMMRSRNALYHRSAALKESIVTPQVMVNALLGFSFLSFVWNSLDVHQIQPYEYNVDQRKGDVKGSGGLMLWSIVPGASLFTALMSNGALRSLTRNSPMKRFMISAGVGVATATGLAFELVRGAMAHKKEHPKKRTVRVNANLEIFHHNQSEIRRFLERRTTEHPAAGVLNLQSPSSPPKEPAV